MKKFNSVAYAENPPRQINQGMNATVFVLGALLLVSTMQLLPTMDDARTVIKKD